MWNCSSLSDLALNEKEFDTTWFNNIKAIAEEKVDHSKIIDIKLNEFDAYLNEAYVDFKVLKKMHEEAYKLFDLYGKEFTDAQLIRYAEIKSTLQSLI